MSSYKVTVGDTAVRVKSLRKVQFVVMEALTNLLAEDPEAASMGAMMANQAFSVGTVQHALEARGNWRTTLTVHGEPVPVVITKRWW